METYFYSKDRDFRLFEANEAYVRTHGAQSADQILGAANEDLFSREIADLCTRQEQFVLDSGNPLVHKIENWVDQEGVMHHVVISRFPLFDEEGNIIGVSGAFSKLEVNGVCDSSSCDRYEAKLVSLMRMMKRDMSLRLGFADLSCKVGVSERHLRRLFRDKFGMGLKAYALQLKMTEAKRQLRLTDSPLIEVAMACGFYDQSSFCNRFHSEEGITPLKFRKRSRI